jgi:hypothetical protein
MSAPPPSRLDGNQVLQGSFDETTGRLRTDAEATIVNADIDVALDATEDSVESWIVDENGNAFTDVNYVPVGQSTHDNLNLNANIQVNNTDVSNGNPVPISDAGGSLTIDNSNIDSPLSTLATEATQQDILDEILLLDRDAGLTTANTLRTVSNIMGVDPNDSLIMNKESGMVNSNSTTTPLLAGATFTGAWTECSHYSCVSFTIRADVDSATNGLKLQFSTDGSTIIRQSMVTHTGSSNGVFYSLPIHGKYFRLVFENGLTNQTTFQLDCQLHEEYNGLGAVPLSTQLFDTSTATTVRSIISGKTVDGVYVNQRASGVSTVNSTNVLLDADETFTGEWEDVLGYSTIALMVHVMEDSATNGLEVQFSSDGINVDDNDRYSIPVNSGSQFSFGVLGQYFRVKYTNGSTPQTEFRLSTMYHITSIKPSSHRIDDTISGENDAELSKAVLTAKNPNGEFVNDATQGEHDANCSTTPLDADGIFRGEWFRWVDNYVSLVSSIFSDVAGTLYIDISSVANPTNGVDTDVSYSLTVDFDPNISAVSRRNTPIQGVWVRHRYVNGIAAQTYMTLQASFTTTDPGDAYTIAAEIPTKQSLVGLKRSIQTIPNADSTGYQDIPVDSSTGNPTVTVQNVRDDLLLRPLSSASAAQVVTGTTATRLDPSPLTNRRTVMLSNDGSSNAAVGFSDGITYDSQSFRLPAGAIRTLSIPESVEVWGITEDTGGTQSTLTRSGSSASGTATDPSNALTSNNTYAIIDANSETIDISGFTAGTANPLVSVKLGMEANKQSGQIETVTYQDVVTGSTAVVSGSVTSGTVTGVNNHLYLAAIGREGASTVTTVIGLGLTWTKVAQQNSPDNNRAVDIWYAIGTVSGNGTVAAAFGTTVNAAHISVSRYSNVSTSSPIQSSATGSANDAAPTTGVLSATNKGMTVMAVEYDNAVTFTAGAGYTTVSAEYAAEGLGVERKPIVSTGAETPTSTINTARNWAAISVALTPASAIDPRVTLSYTLSAVPGATSGVITLTSSSDSSSTVDVTVDRAWVVADIANVNVIATGTTISAAAANVDYIYLELVDTTGNTTRISVVQGAEAVV